MLGVYELGEIYLLCSPSSVEEFSSFIPVFIEYPLPIIHECESS